MNAQQQAALAQAQAAKAKQAANVAPARPQPTPEQKAQLEHYMKQQQMMQQQIQAGVQQGLSTYNIDIQGLNLFAQALETTWKILNVEGNEDEVQKVLDTTRVVYMLIDELVTDRAARRALQKEEEAKALEAQRLAVEEAEKLAAEAAEKDEAPSVEQPQNAPVVVTPAAGEAPAAE